jgi:hypothetical protein
MSLEGLEIWVEWSSFLFLRTASVCGEKLWTCISRAIGVFPNYAQGTIHMRLAK